MKDRRVLPSMLLAAVLAGGPVWGQPMGSPVGPSKEDEAPSSADAMLEAQPFRNSTEGIEFRPPVGGILNRQLGSGEVVRFAYPDRAWTVVLKSAPNSTRMPLVANPQVPGQQGLLDVAVAQLTTNRGGKPAEILKSQVVTVGPNPIGVIEAHDTVGIEPVFVQLALVPARGKYFILQMVAKGHAPEAAARPMFQQMLSTVTLLDVAAFRKEQNLRLDNTRWLWLQLNQKRLTDVVQPIHFMRIVRDGHDVGYVQVNERLEAHHGQDGIYIVNRQHIETTTTTVAETPATPTPAVAATPGLDVPRPAVAPTVRHTQVDRDARFFVTFDRRHEDWTTTDRLDNSPTGNNDAIVMGNSDVELHRALNPVAQRQHGGVREDNEPPVIDREVDTLRVDDYRGKTRSAPAVEKQVPGSYLPQAIAQLLPRLLPIDQPKQYMFAFYVPDQRQVLYRYVDVGVEQAATLDGRAIRAIPITDRVGADGMVTTHYVDRIQGEWLGSVTDNGQLEVLPTDDVTLHAAWKTFAVLPEPPPTVDDDVDRHPNREPLPARGQTPAQQSDPSSFLPPRLDSGTFGGR